MKRNVIFKMAVAVAAFMVFGTVQSTANNSDKFAHNEKIVDGVVVSRDIFRCSSDGNYLTCFKRYIFTYDEEKRISSKEELCWDTEYECWIKSALNSYTYKNSTCSIERSVYSNGKLKKSELYIFTTDDPRLAAASKSYKWDEENGEWITTTSNGTLPQLISLDK